MWSPARLVLLGVGFAVFNAAWEEMIWRGVVFDALERTRLPTGTVVLMQAVSFGVIHLHGFPSGSVGILLASAYGAVLGVLRAQTEPVSPVCHHAVTDFPSSRYCSTLRTTHFAYGILPNPTAGRRAG
jgi:membrane protease YdiL (CAAX protease family)